MRGRCLFYFASSLLPPSVGKVIPNSFAIARTHFSQMSSCVSDTDAFGDEKQSCFAWLQKLHMAIFFSIGTKTVICIIFLLFSETYCRTYRDDGCADCQHRHCPCKWKPIINCERPEKNQYCYVFDHDFVALLPVNFSHRFTITSTYRGSSSMV